jgi:hypothetical protein
MAFGSFALIAQELPQNPEPGKCYVRCTTPDIYVNEEVKIQINSLTKSSKLFLLNLKKEPKKFL